MGVKPTFDHSEARRLYGKVGWTQARIAKHFGKSRKTIQQVCSGVSPAVDHRAVNGMRNLTGWHAEKIVAGLARRKAIADLQAEGVRHAEIAVRVGISTSRVRTILAELRAVGDIDLEPIEVPAWTPSWLRDTYLEIGARDGEEAAASHCRRLKAEAAASCR